MDVLQWRRLNDLFHSAMDRAAGERQAWLEQACADDAVLAAHVERLVRAHERASGFIRTEDSPVQQLAGNNRAPAREFVGTDRFAVRRTLGVGGMGVVYEVHDRARDEIVALKTLLHARPADILRLKREFRSLANVAHVNLVSLYELFADDEQCFFTMELVDGVNFVDAVRLPGVDGDRPRRLLTQLVEGVSELHRLGKLHRDIKPSNVRVTHDGRVVILDFGLIADTAARIAALDDRLAGTPAYMSPEQATGAPASEASDWYGVGVTLYEALTGQLPFPGTFGRAPGPGTERDPPAPTEVSPDIPEDLSAICMELLCRDPLRRINGVDAIKQFSGNTTVTTSAKPHSGPSPFVGREWHLGVLRESFQASREGRTSAVHVCGPSGIGKSALVRQFLDRLQVGDEVVVLSGRCYENESVPYKALDGIVDNLSHYLASMSPESAAALVPPDVTALARLFPVLDRVASAPDREADPVRLRRRAFDALRELFARIARHRPLVLFIDDLHWADADSALLLEELLRPPDPPPLLLLSCFRTEEMDGKPFLRTLLGGGAVPLPLAPMTDAESRELIATALPGGSPVAPDDATRLVREAEGNPFLLEQMAHYVALPRTAAAHAPTLDEMLDARLHGLPAGAREFLTTLAICGRPMIASLVGEASGLTGDERPVVTTLRSTNFVRTSGALDRVEIYHDRIREVVASRLDSDTFRRVHRRLADTLTARRIDDPEALFDHWRGAGGEDERASIQAVAAARKASAALAFDRAAMFYRHALDLASDAAHPEWKEGLATALANAGRPADAAAVYLQAAEDAHGAQRLELQRKSAEQYLTAGHFDRGVEVVRAVLGAAGMRFPRGPRQALASLLVRRARLQLRGLKFRELRREVIAPDVLLRVDTCWSVFTGMVMVDTVRSFDFESRHLLAALEAGEPYRIARGLAAETTFHAARGGVPSRYAAEVARMAEELSERVGHPHAIALTTLTAGQTAVLRGEWRRASPLCERALTLLLETCVGVTWELSGAQTFLLGALLYQGELQDVARRLTPAIASAKDHGNLYLEAELRTRMMNLVLLAADQPLEAERQAQDVMDRWWKGGFTRQHLSHLLGRATTALYRGDGEAAWRIVAENRAAVSRTQLLRVQLLRIEMSFLRGRCALAAASAARDPAARRRLLSVASGESRRLARERMPWSDGFARLLKATVASQTGDAPTAEQQLAAAVDAFDRAGMRLYAAGTRRRLGLFLGDRGRPLIVAAEEWMASQGIRNPRSMTRMVAPGFPD